MPEVSVIIPVFNIEAYLERCLQSVLQQSLSNIEVICVNDGSTDSSAEILARFQQEDSRIVIENQGKSGQGVARNRGIELAHGKYIAFVDGDDRLEPTMLEKLFRAAESHHSEIAFCFSQSFDEEGKKVKYPYFDGEAKAFGNYKKVSLLSLPQLIPKLSYLTVVCWNKLYRKRFLQRCGAAFAHTTIHEDIPFFYQAVLSASAISLVPERLYHYSASRTGSSTRAVMSTAPTLLHILQQTEARISNKLQKDPRLLRVFEKFKAEQILSFIVYAYHREDVSAFQKTYFYARGRRQLLSIKAGRWIELRGAFKWQFLFVRYNLWVLFRISTLLEGLRYLFQNDPRQGYETLKFHLRSIPTHVNYQLKKLK